MATIKEIAKRCGVSPMTVSNVVNRKYNKVSKKTIARVEEVIRELNYIPNMSARSLKSNNTKIVVLIIPQLLGDVNNEYALQNPFYGAFINSIEYNLRKNGYYMLLRFVGQNELYKPLIRQWNADGIIVLGPSQEEFDLNLKDIDLPVVLVDSYVKESDNYSRVTSDDRLGGELAAKVLYESGCRRLAYVSTYMCNHGVGYERYVGFNKFLESKGIKLNPDFIFEGAPTYEYAFELANTLYENKIDGVFAFSDLLALGIIDGLKKSGHKVPDDISVIGFDGLFAGEIISPRLTTIKQNVYEKCENVVSLLIKAIEEKPYKENIVLPVSLQIKDSVKRKEGGS